MSVWGTPYTTARIKRYSECEEFQFEKYRQQRTMMGLIEGQSLDESMFRFDVWYGCINGIRMFWPLKNVWYYLKLVLWRRKKK